MISFKYTPIKDFIKKHNPTSPEIKEIKSFQSHIKTLLQDAPKDHREKSQEQEIESFFNATFSYKTRSRDNIDLAILVDDKVNVIIEVKAQNNQEQFITSKDFPLAKALAQAIFYFLKEHENNNFIKHIIICTYCEYYVYDAQHFTQFEKDRVIGDLFKGCKNNTATDSRTDAFYESLQEYLKSPKFTGELPYTYFCLNNNLSTEELSAIYQLLSPQVLLKEEKILDANTLNKNFYEELLYILGLQEVSENGKSGGKILITPSTTKNTLANAIAQAYENIDEESIFTLITTWNNRILFLRLLESMLLNFKHIDEPFLNISIIESFKTLQTLFFEVLAKTTDKRSSSLPKRLLQIPYLNSSLFDRIPLEREGKEIGLLDSYELPLFSRSILKKNSRFKDKDSLPLLDYLFAFLHAYKFTTTSKDIVDEVDTSHDILINSAVLGLVFEKLNGYKEGSFYTPSFITSYICKESITQAVIEKFNQVYQWEATSLEEVRNYSIRCKLSTQELLCVLLSLRICDPAVGSGHFLVSALNEIIKIAYELGLISSFINNTTLELKNDEILIKTQGVIHQYTKPNDPSLQFHKIQVELFHLKKSIIENCLFGVDINPNSCEITKLRLWIELLKYSYYLFDDKGENTNALETLPNIDINIKCGNSLISYFGLDDSFSYIQNIKEQINQYKHLVKCYKEGIYENKSEIDKKILDLQQIFKNSCLKQKYAKESEVFLEQCQKYSKNYGDYLAKEDLELSRFISAGLFVLDFDENEAKKDFQALKDTYRKIFSLEENKPFEWRFAFPEVLDEEGNFLGFDCIIGNPPYIKEGGNKELFAPTKHLRTYQGKMDIWYHFAGRGLELLKQGGELSFIATNNWTTNTGAGKLRNILLQETRFISLIDFGDYKVFDSADIQTMIMRFKKANSPKYYSFDYRKIIAEKPSDANRITLLEKREYEGNLYLDANINIQNLKDKTFSFSHFDSIFETILGNEILFLTEEEVAQGIVYPQENINKNSLEKLGGNFKIGQGIQKLSNDEKNILKLSQKELELLKPIYETSEIVKYFVIPQNQYWVIYTDSSFKKPNSMDNYPKLKKHLDRFKEVITSDNKPYGLHRARDEKFFMGSPRIIALRKCAKEPIFSYVDFDCYVSATFYIIKTDRFDSKFLTGLLNSSLIRFWLKHKGKMQGNNYQIDKEPLINIPLIKITESNQPTADKIIALVEKILTLKESDPKANTQDLEKEIDSLVYTLYGLSDDEIQIIEEGRK